MKKVLLVTAAIMLIGGCASNNAEFDSLVAQAEKEIKVAKSMDFLWRDTEKVLAEAKKAQDAGEDAEATKLAKKALNQAKLAQKQAKDNANVRPVYR